ncbi:hypothetical protein [Paraburkholderia sp. C35]|uniref:hypothetical protein n=1 Tax=Paraburkholderia sp. C35 TaxID=2126993 RepID=UPI000D694BD8|nr:hypothetical protein [Paraburkholderia sp. C35]
MTTTYKSTDPYLEARGDFVLAKIAMIGDPNAEDMTYEALIEAQVLGYRDASVAHETGEDIECSPFFADVPELKREWLDGWSRHDEMAEMAECSGCNNSRGDPCPIHG